MANSYLQLQNLPNIPVGIGVEAYHVTEVQESGVAFSFYSDGGSLHAFIYIPEDGVYALEDLLTQPGAQLEEPVLTTPNGYIAGLEQGSGGQFSTNVFLLKRQVP